MEDPAALDEVAASRPDVETRSEALGSRIRAERRVAGMTVRGLASRTGLSPSLISQVERGRATPSVATLWAIATELGLSVADLFNDEPEMSPDRNGRKRPGAPPLQPRESRKAITLEDGVRWERLTSSSDDEVDFVHVEYPVGAASCGEDALVRHGGREFGYVLSGTLGVRIGFDEYEVRENDSISFDSSMPHRLWAIGDVPVRAIWMVINRRADPRGKLLS
jgi:transcriptional regulator with XRE-family HTH domain